MLTVGVADRAEDLVDVLVDHLATPLPDPFQAEWVSVPSLGFRSWLRFRLAERLGAGAGGAGGDGIAANIEMPFPGSLRWRVLRAHNAALGVTDGSDPWEVDRLVWSVLEVMADPESDIDQRLRRSSLPTGVTLASRAGPIADLFDRYGVHRPHMVQAWAAGRNVGADGQPLPADRLWQPRLYRAVRDRVADRHDGLPPPAERLVEALEMVRTGTLDLSEPMGPLEPGLPPRLHVVGQSILTAELGPVLEAVATRADVHVLLLSPSARTSIERAGIATGGPTAPAGPTSWAFPRKVVPPTGRAGNPLIESWGRRPLESALLLGAGGVVPDHLGRTERGQAPASLLARIQQDLRADDPPAGDHTGPVPDASLQVHAAPGRTRQVEVLRDVILGLLRDHPDLREDDIAVLCPKLDEFAPVISAVLGPSARRGAQPEDGLPALRYAVVDRDARSFNPVLAAMQTLLEVLPGRFDTISVRDLLHAPAVRNRFGLSTDDLGLLSEWIDDTGIRWGLDGPQRNPWGIDPSHRANSWAAGADQLMAGVALGDPLRYAPVTGFVPVSPHALAEGGIAPMELSEGAIASAGRLTAAIRSIAHVHQRLLGTAASGADGAHRSASEWRDVLTEAADHLLAPNPFEDWQRAALDDAFATLLIASGDHHGSPSATPLTFGDIRRLLAPALEGPRARADLGFGSVVFARPALLAGVPFRVICILGLDDEAMPPASVGGDDLLTAQPFIGDREPRAEARAELLAALQSTRDHLVITATSRDVRTNVEVPRSVVLDELLDVVAATVAPDAPRLPDHTDLVVRTHPRQGFDPGNFSTTGAPPFSFDGTARRGAEAMVERLLDPSRGAGPELLLSARLSAPADQSDVVDLAELTRFYEHPVKYFFRTRLRFTLPSAQDEDDTQLPTQLDKLQGSGIGRDLTAIGMELGDPSGIRIDASGPSPDLPEEVLALLANFRARGILPPSAAANPELAAMSEEIEHLLTIAAELDALRSADDLHRVDIDLPGGHRLRGSVGGCCGGDAPGPLHIMYSRFKPKYVASMQIGLLALTAQEPNVRWRGILLTRGAGKEPAEPCVRFVRGANPDERRHHATTALAALVAQYHDGLRYPLPLFDGSSYELVNHPKGSVTSWGSLVKDQWSYRRESQDPHHQLAFGRLDLEDLMALDAGGHTFAGEAHRLWTTLDAALETQGDDGS